MVDSDCDRLIPGLFLMLDLIYSSWDISTVKFLTYCLFHQHFKPRIESQVDWWIFHYWQTPDNN